MHFTEQEKNFILQDFPKFELSYENMTHNKVHNADILLAIPEGKKCYAWFTSYKEDNVCFLLELSENKIKHISEFLEIYDQHIRGNDAVDYNFEDCSGFIKVIIS